MEFANAGRTWVGEVRIVEKTLPCRKIKKNAAPHNTMEGLTSGGEPLVAQPHRSSDSGRADFPDRSEDGRDGLIDDPPSGWIGDIR